MGWSAWQDFVHRIKNANFSCRGELNFVWKTTTFDPQDACRIPADIQSFTPINLSSGDYYRIDLIVII